MNSNKDKVEELRWQRTKIGNDGFICLVDAMGADEDVVQAARVSYNADTRDDATRLLATLRKLYPNKSDLGCVAGYNAVEIAKGKQDVYDEETGLLRYLMRHRHTTPLEMAEIKFLVRVPMDTWRQWIRHRTANVNEYSTRYTEAIDSRQTTDHDKWRLQATNNKQGSSGLLTHWPDPEGNVDLISLYKGMSGDNGDFTPGQYLSVQEARSHEASQKLYEERLRFGIAREQARKDLPLSTYTEAYWKCDLHNILHFLGLRMDSHAQLEIRQYANAMGAIVAQLYPRVWKAFEDYRLNGMTLSGPEIAVISKIAGLGYQPSTEGFEAIAIELIPNKRERGECRDKCLRMNLIYIKE